MIKKFMLCALSGVAALGFVSCDDNDNPEKKNEFPTLSKGNSEAFVLTQGNYYSKIEGELNVIDLAEQTQMQDVFATVNKRSLGATPQCGLVYGDKIYLGMYESNTIEILDSKTYESLRQISLSGSTQGQQPRSMVAAGGKVYISMYDGYLARLDTLTQKIDGAVKVGPNPEKICIHKDKVYVPNSDGMNWQNGYADGTTVSVVNLSSFSVEKTLTVPLNPGNCVSAGDNVFVLCKGDYYEIPSRLYRIEDDGSTTDIVAANMITASGDKVYAIESHYDKSGNFYNVYDASTKTMTQMTFPEIDYPNGIAVDKTLDKIIISSNVWGSASPDYDAPGYVVEYKLDGTFLKKYPSGVGEASIFFKK